jgi:DNA-binding MarR family transcriptional regulator
MDTPALPPLNQFLCFAVYSANLAFNRLYGSLLAEHGLTYPQYLVLAVLSNRGTAKVTELADVLNLESNTLTPLLKRMEAAKLVNRTRSRDDERVVHVNLAPAGKALATTLGCVPGDVAAALKMSQAEAVNLTAELTALARGLRAHVARHQAAA